MRSDRLAFLSICMSLQLKSGTTGRGVAGHGRSVVRPSVVRPPTIFMRASDAVGLSVPSATLVSTADAAFERAVQLCEAKVRAPMGAVPLSAEVPRLLRQTFEADFERLLQSDKVVTNLTCMRPAAGAEGSQRFDGELLGLALERGRVCLGGDCCNSCSRVIFRALASRQESECFRQHLSAVMSPAAQHPHHNLYFIACCAAGDVRTTLMYMRLIERMRRAIAHEYGLSLQSIAPRQTFVSRITGEAHDSSRQLLHADESSFAEYHYSCVLYLSDQHEDFCGGGFAFCDPAASPQAEVVSEEKASEVKAGEEVAREEVAASAAVPPDVVLTSTAKPPLTKPPLTKPPWLANDGSDISPLISPLSPKHGTAVIFSSGWENMHFVEPVTTGCRFALPAFFVTRAEPSRRLEQQAGAVRRAADDRAIADALWRALMPESEHDVRQLVMDWHLIFA